MVRTRRAALLEAEQRVVSQLCSLSGDVLPIMLHHCSESALRHLYAAFRTWHPEVAAELWSRLAVVLAPVVRLPPNSQNCCGFFVRQPELINGRPWYLAKDIIQGYHGTFRHAIWHCGKAWTVGWDTERGEKQGFHTSGIPSLVDAEDLSWQSFVGILAPVVEHRWVATQLRCCAVAAELARAGSFVCLAGSLPDECSGEKAALLRFFGTFKKCESLTNRRPSYVKADDPGVMLWFSGACWTVGPAAWRGKSSGYLVCLCPEAVRLEHLSKAWQVALAGGWIGAPGVRLLCEPSAV